LDGSEGSGEYAPKALKAGCSVALKEKKNPPIRLLAFLVKIKETVDVITKNSKYCSGEGVAYT
jgi:hypothetical protein